MIRFILRFKRSRGKGLKLKWILCTGENGRGKVRKFSSLGNLIGLCAFSILHILIFYLGSSSLVEWQYLKIANLRHCHKNHQYHNRPTYSFRLGLWRILTGFPKLSWLSNNTFINSETITEWSAIRCYKKRIEWKSRIQGSLYLYCLTKTVRRAYSALIAP